MKKIHLFLIPLIIGCASKPENKKTSSRDSEILISDTTTKEKTEKIDTESINIKNIPSSTNINDFLISKRPTKNYTIIDSNSGIFISIRDSEIEYYKKEDEEEFYVAADDHVWYKYEAAEFLRSKNVKTVYPQTRYLIFKQKDQKELYFDILSPKHSCSWKMILFNIDSLPKIIYSIDVKEEYETYFTE